VSRWVVEILQADWMRWSRRKWLREWMGGGDLASRLDALEPEEMVT
jgi:hypothetical protein